MERGPSLTIATTLLLAAACAPAQTPCPSASPLGTGAAAVISPTPLPAATGAREGVRERAASGTGICWTKGRPSKTAPTRVLDAHPYCARLDMNEVARVEARVRKDFVVTEPPSKLVVDFGCEVAHGTVQEVFFEDGSGHGGTLRIVRFKRDGGRIVSFDALIKSVRVPLLVRPHLVRMFDPNAKSLHVGGVSSSSRDFHLRLSFVDEEGRVTDRGFTGYESSTAQGDILPMNLATEPIQKLLAATSFTTAPATDEDRRMFTERFAVTLSGSERGGQGRGL